MRVAVVPAFLRVPWRLRRCWRGGSARQRQPGWPQRVIRSARVPGSAKLTSARRAASSAARGAGWGRWAAGGVTTKRAPAGRERAKNLLWAAGKLADYALGLGLDAVPEVLLHPSVTERFTRCAPGLSGPARRTLRTNLRFIGRRVVPQLYPQDLPLPRERAKEPYSLAEIGGFLALADAQP